MEPSETKQKTAARNSAGQRLGHVAAELKSLRMIYNDQVRQQQGRDTHLVRSLDHLSAVQRDMNVVLTDLVRTAVDLTTTIEGLRNQVNTLLGRVEEQNLRVETYIVTAIEAFDALRARVDANCGPAVRPGLRTFPPRDQAA